VETNAPAASKAQVTALKFLNIFTENLRSSIQVRLLGLVTLGWQS
jgi:hypothetical protein